MLKHNIYTADFETTGVKNLQQDKKVRVWLWSLVNIDTMEPKYGTDLDSFFLSNKKAKSKMYLFS